MTFPSRLWWLLYYGYCYFHRQNGIIKGGEYFLFRISGCFRDKTQIINCVRNLKVFINALMQDTCFHSLIKRENLCQENIKSTKSFTCIQLILHTNIYLCIHDFLLVRRVVLPISYKKIHNLAYWNFYYDLKFYKVQVCAQKPYQFYVMRIIYFLFFYVLPEAISFISICYETLK